jgi:hypothetical protein
MIPSNQITDGQTDKVWEISNLLSINPPKNRLNFMAPHIFEKKIYKIK